MDRLDNKYVKLRYGLTFRKLLEKNINQHNINKVSNIEDPYLIHSLGGLSSTTGLRKATLSDIFTGKTYPSGKSVYMILDALKVTFREFGEYFDKITEKDIEEYEYKIKEEAERKRGK